MPMDPISFWIQSSVFWARVMRQQHEAYLRLLGAMAVTVPQPSATDLAQQAQSQAAPDATSVVLMERVKGARAKMKAKPAQELATA